MIVRILVGLGVGILVGLGIMATSAFIWYMVERYKKKKESQIPKELLEDLEKAGKRFAQYLREDKSIRGEQVLFELMNERREANNLKTETFIKEQKGGKNARETNNDGGIDAGKPVIEVNAIQDSSLAERGEIQDGNIESNDRTECSNVGSEQEHPGVEKVVRRRSIFNRFRRN